MHAGLREFNLHLGLLQAQENVLLLIRPPSTESLLENLDRRRLQEEKSRIEIGLLDLLHTLITKNLCVSTNSTSHLMLSKVRMEGPTSISISKIHVLPFSATFFTACTLVP